jgi:RNA polymerase sigma-70 factor (ECF subfamily)
MSCLYLKSNVMKKNKSTDAQLVSAYMKGEELAISELITRHKQKNLQFYLFKSI